MMRNTPGDTRCIDYAVSDCEVKVVRTLTCYFNIHGSSHMKHSLTASRPVPITRHYIDDVILYNTQFKNS